jgi:predicted RNase H-like HicB family nuclease
MRNQELSGCMSQGNPPEEAIPGIEDAPRRGLEAALRPEVAHSRTRGEEVHSHKGGVHASHPFQRTTACTS